MYKDKHQITTNLKSAAVSTIDMPTTNIYKDCAIEYQVNKSFGDSAQVLEPTQQTP